MTLRVFDRSRTVYRLTFIDFYMSTHRLFSVLWRLDPIRLNTLKRYQISDLVQSILKDKTVRTPDIVVFYDQAVFSYIASFWAFN